MQPLSGAIQGSGNLSTAIHDYTPVLRIRGGGKDLFESTDEEEEEDYNMDMDKPPEDLSVINEEEGETTPAKKQKTDQTAQPLPLSASRLAKMSPHQILAEFKKIHPTTTHEGCVCPGLQGV